MRPDVPADDKHAALAPAPAFTQQQPIHFSSARAAGRLSEELLGGSSQALFLPSVVTSPLFKGQTLFFFFLFFLPAVFFLA